MPSRWRAGTRALTGFGAGHRLVTQAAAFAEFRGGKKRPNVVGLNARERTTVPLKGTRPGGRPGCLASQRSSREPGTSNTGTNFSGRRYVPTPRPPAAAGPGFRSAGGVVERLRYVFISIFPCTSDMPNFAADRRVAKTQTNSICRRHASGEPSTPRRLARTQVRIVTLQTRRLRASPCTRSNSSSLA
jgi:hypothetical protein